MKAKIFALVAAFFMLMGGSAWAQSDVKGDVNKDGVVNEQDIAAILSIMAKNNGVAEKTKYYWYAGWTEPTASNIATIINNEYPAASGSTTNNKAGKTATSISGVTMDYTKNTLYNSAAKTNYYVVVPNGQSVYDSDGTDLIKDPYLFGGTPYSTFTNHNVYKTTTTSRNINAIIIR